MIKQKEGNTEIINKYADRIKVTVYTWASGKARWDISVAGETSDEVLAEIDNIDEKLWQKYYGKSKERDNG